MVMESSASRILFGISLCSDMVYGTVAEEDSAVSFLIFGHRGSPRRFPENTVASFEEALRAGADGFETDLRLLADKTAVLFHDDEIGEAEVETLGRADVRADTLDVLAQFAGRCTMVLEVKRSKWEDV